MANTALVELWLILVICITFTIVRLGVQIRNRGLRSLHVEDHFATLAAALLVVQICTTQETLVLGGTSFDETSTQRANLTSGKTEALSRGQRWYFADLTLYVTISWLLKASVLFFLSRIVRDLNRGRLIRFTFGVIILSYVAIIISMFASCHSFSQLFQVQAESTSSACQNLLYWHYIPTFSLNTFTDILIMSIPASLMLSTTPNSYRKLIFGTFLTAGFFLTLIKTYRMVKIIMNPSNSITIARWSDWILLFTFLVTNMCLTSPLFNHAIEFQLNCTPVHSRNSSRQLHAQNSWKNQKANEQRIRDLEMHVLNDADLQLQHPPPAYSRGGHDIPIIHITHVDVSTAESSVLYEKEVADL